MTKDTETSPSALLVGDGAFDPLEEGVCERVFLPPKSERMLAPPMYGGSFPASVFENPIRASSMEAAEGILTARGGMTSHAALVARQMGKVCVAGCEALHIDYAARVMRVNGTVLKEGDWISVDGSTGEVIRGEVQTRPSEVLQVLLEKTLSPSKSSLYRQYAKAMYNTSLRITNNTADAEDVLQEAAEKAWDQQADHRCGDEGDLASDQRGALGPLQRQDGERRGTDQRADGGVEPGQPAALSVCASFGHASRARAALNLILRNSAPWWNPAQVECAGNKCDASIDTRSESSRGSTAMLATMPTPMPSRTYVLITSASRAVSATCGVMP